MDFPLCLALTMTLALAAYYVTENQRCGHVRNQHDARRVIWRRTRESFLSNILFQELYNLPEEVYGCWKNIQKINQRGEVGKP